MLLKLCMILCTNPHSTTSTMAHYYELTGLVLATAICTWTINARRERIKLEDARRTLRTSYAYFEAAFHAEKAVYFEELRAIVGDDLDLIQVVIRQEQTIRRLSDELERRADGRAAR